MDQSFSKKIKILLHGRLKKYASEAIEVSVDTVEQAVHALCLHCPSMKQERIKERITMQILGYECKDSLYAKLDPSVTELHFFPAFVGAGGKSGGFLQIAIGIALIAIAAPAGLALLSGTMGSIALSMGISLALGGLMQLMAPAPNRDSGNDGATDPAASKYIGATVNSTKIGTRIPIIYGMVRAGGHYISFDVDAKDVEMARA
jgi:predicted phage tail protein